MNHVFQFREINLTVISEVYALALDLSRRAKSNNFQEGLFQYIELKYPLNLRLSELSNLGLGEVCALMWLGRDYYEGMEASWSSLVSEGQSNDPDYISGKSILDKYITRGLNRLGLLSEFDSLRESYDESIFVRKKALNVSEFSSELYSYLSGNPEAIRLFSSSKFEQLIADILKGLGYEVHLTKQTRDGGRDILAYFSTPLGKILTVVECKKYAEDRPIGIDLIERFLYVLDRKDDASYGMLITTSRFSSEARKIENDRKFRLTLKDFDNLKEMIQSRGKYYDQNKSGLWLPKR